MKARITAPEGYTYSPDGFTEITVPMGETVEGDIAEGALSKRAAQRIMSKAEPLENKATKPASTKRGRK